MEIESVIVVLATFLLAGCIKGIVGLGLPTISVAILSGFMPLPLAIQIMVVPGTITNIWQAMDGKKLKYLLERLWLFLLLNGFVAWLAYRYVLPNYPNEMKLLLGVLLCLYALTGLGIKPPRLRAKHEKLAAVVCGALTGFFAGTTGNTSISSVAFLDSLGLDRHTFVQAMGLAFGVPLLVMLLASTPSTIASNSILLVAVLSLLCAGIGMWFGKKIRHRISEILFRKLLFIALLFIGLRLVWATVF